MSDIPCSVQYDPFILHSQMLYFSVLSGLPSNDSPNAGKPDKYPDKTRRLLKLIFLRNTVNADNDRQDLHGIKATNHLLEYMYVSFGCAIYHINKAYRSTNDIFLRTTGLHYLKTDGKTVLSLSSVYCPESRPIPRSPVPSIQMAYKKFLFPAFYPAPG